MRLTLIKTAVLAFTLIGMYPATATELVLEPGGELAGEMVSIPAGSFYMGDLSRDWESDSGEQPVHRETRWHSAGLMPAVWNYNDKKPFHLYSGRVAKVRRIAAPPDNIPVRRVTVPAFKLGKYCMGSDHNNPLIMQDKGMIRRLFYGLKRIF